MNIDVKILTEFVKQYVPVEKQVDALSWLVEHSAKWGGSRKGAGAKIGNQNARKKAETVSESVSEAPKAKVITERTKFVAGRQNWTFPGEIRAFASKYWSETTIRNIEKEFSCQEWTVETTINDLLKTFPSEKTPVVEVVDPFEKAFQDWWKIFPKQRKGGTAKPKTKFISLLKNKQFTVQEIMESTLAYAASDEVARGFAKEPYSWLLNERWKTNWNMASQQTAQNINKIQELQELVDKYEN